jgi:hypothetical protein
MIRIRGPDQASRITDPGIRQLIERRFTEICAGEPYDRDVHGEMVVVEPGDTLESVEEETGLPIATNPFDECRFPDANFLPVAEALEEHAATYEMTFILTDDGCGVSLFIPKRPDIDPELLSLCAKFSVPAFDPATR